MKKSYFLVTLVLWFTAAGCTTVDLPPQTAVPSTPAETLNRVTATHTPIKTPTRPAASEPPTTAPAPGETIEPPTTVTVPMETGEALSKSDPAEIYATAVREVYTVDHTFGGDPPEFPFVYIVTTTADGTLLEAPAIPPQELSAELQQSIAAQLTDLPFEAIWIEDLDDAPVDPNTGSIAAGQGIVITLGNILPQEDGTVQLPVFMVCGGLCALGKTYVLDQVDGVWQVTGSVGPEIMA